MTRKQKYADYLESIVWRKKREEVLLRDDYRCRFCNSSLRLRVHHRVYPKHFGKEPLSDLITICESCHKLFHKYTGVCQKIEKDKTILQTNNRIATDILFDKGIIKSRTHRIRATKLAFLICGKELERKDAVIMVNNFVKDHVMLNNPPLALKRTKVNR